jgi:hypothetical protein
MRKISLKVRRIMDFCKHQVAVSKLRFGRSSLVLDFWKRKFTLLSEH